MHVDRNRSNPAPDRQAAMEERRRQCERMAAKARRAGFDVTWERVNRHYGWFLRWDEGRLATGYLVRRTGIRKL